LYHCASASFATLLLLLPPLLLLLLSLELFVTATAVASGAMSG
jgi:hypothetical protein